ncbi:hypothetical protein DSO57_1013040 [Entomophthora muscae]|uniref:Uncharacterized protein n=1 Tax=Entomophthora muscae TaxID=34485 RepID=A0ACC2RWY3_9FUNG|nr:hypothetical protein DSO57_1013040 [Entomophthora muscae]
MKCPPMACPASEGIPLLATSAVTIPPGSQAILDSQISYELPERTFLELYSLPSVGCNKPYLCPGILDVSHKDPVQLLVAVVNNGIHHVLILPLLGHFEDKSLAFAFNSQNELASASGNMIVWFPDSAQLTRPTNTGGK